MLDEVNLDASLKPELSRLRATLIAERRAMVAQRDRERNVVNVDRPLPPLLETG